MRRFRLPPDLKTHLTLATRCKTVESRALYLGNLGFHRLPHLKRDVEVWRSLKLRLVLKHAFFLADYRKDVCCPTVWLDTGDVEEFRLWVVQPLVTREESGKALETLKARLPERHGLDLHRANVGWLGEGDKKVAVAFDW